MSALDDTLPGPAREATAARLPIPGLIALACAAFITVLTESIVAGLLPPMSRDLGLGESLIGQLLTAYALGSLLTAIPLVKLTSHLPRRPLLMTALAGFALANSAMTWTDSYALMLASRFVGGVAAGLLWALLVGYASRMVAQHQQGRAISIALVGIPLAMTLGIPASAWLAQLVGWRWVFGLMSLLSLALVGCSRLVLPPVPGVPAQQRGNLREVLARPGLAAVYAVMLLAVLAHNALYTYVAPFAALSGSQGMLDRLLLLFGVTSVVGIVATGALIDRWMHALVAAEMGLFLLAAGAMALWPASQVALIAGVATWGLGFGGMSALIQTAVVRRSGEQQDLAQSLVVVGWNLAIAGGGAAGGMLLRNAGATTLPWLLVALLVATLLVVLPAKKAWA
ncbi:MFS transporter [Frateuria sp. Soil773]|uniref:MFS transporter n=1 Tax=Frateuria sp. Soil773 TaxID=1736407 RepID=UPI0006F90BD0|nr:MFS transporter [Frateuria sp. Soil773]KRE95006.1 MFS transporter [Frateuria sp. Soil773]